MRPLAGQPRQEIFELGELNLQLAFVAARPLGEDVQDQLAAIDDSNLKRGFKITLLRGREIFIDDNQVGVSFLQRFLNFVDLAAADQSRWRDALNVLAVLFENRRTRRLGQSFELFEVEIQRRRVTPRRQCHANEQRPFLRVSR